MKSVYVIVATIVAVVAAAIIAVVLLKKRKKSHHSPSPPLPSGCNPPCSSPLQSCVNNSCAPPSTALATLKLQLSAGQFATCADQYEVSRTISVSASPDTNWTYCFATTVGGLVPGLYYTASGVTYSASVTQKNSMYQVSMTNTSRGATKLDLEPIPGKSNAFAMSVTTNNVKAYASALDSQTQPNAMILFDSSTGVSNALSFTPVFTS